MKQPTAKQLRLELIRNDLDMALSSLEALKDDVNERYKAISGWLEEADKELEKLVQEAS